MSRSGYTDDCDDQARANCYRGAVAQAIRGARGQKALRELAEAMDAMPVKELAAESLVTADGQYCTLGVLGAARGVDMSCVDPEDWQGVARLFGIAPSMVREVVYENDDVLSDFYWTYVTICGPMRPSHWEDNYGRHEKQVRLPIDRLRVAELRWKHMREWVARHITSP